MPSALHFCLVTAVQQVVTCADFLRTAKCEDCNWLFQGNITNKQSCIESWEDGTAGEARGSDCKLNISVY